MNIAKVTQGSSTTWAAIACLAVVLLLNVARADEAGRPLCDQTASSPCSPAQCFDAMPCENEIGQKGAWPQPTKFSAGDCSEQESAASRVWQWVPLGMIPYIGPRTPDDQKDLGIGIPLVGKGWRTQPFSISTFIGFTDGGALVRGHVNQRPSFYGGFNFGWDYDHYWGIEKRLGFGALNLTNGEHQSIANTGMSVTGEYRLMYYPLGDTRWRPFLTAGVGWSDFYFNDDRGVSHLDTVGMVPVGFGLKYLYTERLAVRIDLIDEITFGYGSLSNFQYVAFTAGVEYRYGKQLLRMPWHWKKST